MCGFVGVGVGICACMCVWVCKCVGACWDEVGVCVHVHTVVVVSAHGSF